MVDRANPNCATYEVGYKRPPRATQFQPGTSGNRRGRPKGPKTVGAVLRDVLRRKVEVTEKGKTRRIGILEVMLRRLANEAMRSDPRAIKLLFFLMDRYAESAEGVHHLEELLAEDRELLTHFLERSIGAASAPDTNAENAECDDGR
jgi:hypothetical protein